MQPQMVQAWPQQQPQQQQLQQVQAAVPAQTLEAQPAPWLPTQLWQNQAPVTQALYGSSWEPTELVAMNKATQQLPMYDQSLFDPQLQQAAPQFGSMPQAQQFYVQPQGGRWTPSATLQQASLLGAEQMQWQEAGPQSVRVADNMARVSALANSIGRTSQLEEQLQRVTEQLRIAAAVEEGLVAQRAQAQAAARQAQDELAKVKQQDAKAQADLKLVQELANAQATKEAADQTELQKKNAELANLKTLEKQAEDIAERALLGQREEERRRRQAESREVDIERRARDFEASAVQELKHARLDVQRARAAYQQVQAEAAQARAAQAAAEEQVARAAVLQAAQAQSQMATEVQSAQTNMAQAEELMQGWSRNGGRLPQGSQAEYQGQPQANQNQGQGQVAYSTGLAAEAPA